MYNEHMKRYSVAEARAPLLEQAAVRLRDRDRHADRYGPHVFSCRRSEVLPVVVSVPGSYSVVRLSTVRPRLCSGQAQGK